MNRPARRRVHSDMGVLRAAAIAFVLALIGTVGVAAALVAAVVAASVAEGGLPPAYVVGFAFLYCTGPAAVLAWLAYGGIHLSERLWTRATGARVVAVVAGRGRRLRGGAPGASGPAAFHAPVVMPAPLPPSPTVLGVAVAVPLAFLNLPGWLAVEYGVVEGLGGAAAIFVVPGVVCGALIGKLVEGLRRR